MQWASSNEMTRVLGKNLFPNTTFPMDMSALMTGMRLRQDVSELSSSLPELLAPPPPVSGTSQPSLPTGTPSLVPSWARKNVHNNHNIIDFYSGPAQLTTDPCSLFVSNQFAVASKKRKLKLLRNSKIGPQLLRRPFLPCSLNG